MKSIFKIGLLVFVAGVFCGCKEDINYVENRHSTPVINSIAINNGESITLPAKLSISYDVSDKVAPLSTLEILVKDGDVTYINEKVRTKGNSVAVEDYEIDFPFTADIPEELEVDVIFTLMNVDGNWCQEVKTLTVERPVLPATIYFVAEDKTVYDMTLEGGVYSFAEGSYPSTLAGFIATDSDLDEAEFIWGSAGENNVAAIVEDQSAEKLTISYESWKVSLFTFDPITFGVGVEGIELSVAINGVQMNIEGEYLIAEVEFTKGGVFTIAGLDDVADVADAYNRDFMTYDADSKSLTFLGESGAWSVAYSLKHKYFWVYRSDDVAPASYWLVGSGFCQAPVWDAEHPGGWTFDDIVQRGYLRNMGDGSYQITLYMGKSPDAPWVDIQILGDLTWNNVFTFSSTEAISAPAEAGLAISGKTLADIVDAEGFTPGYYKLTFYPAKNADGKEVVIELEGDDDGGAPEPPVVTDVPTINGVAMQSSDTNLYTADVEFTAAGTFKIAGVDNAAAAYNRDFMTYDSASDSFTFLGESGTWNVAYSIKHNYFWVYKSDQVAPDCYWLVGAGFCQSPIWDSEHPGGWSFTDVVQRGYFRNMGDGSYQMTTYIGKSTNVEWVDLQLYSQLAWDTEFTFSSAEAISAPAEAGLAISGKTLKDVVDADGFTPGYYKMTFYPAKNSDGNEIVIEAAI